MTLKSIIPVINTTDNNHIVLEWWNQNKKLVLYVEDYQIDYLKVVNGNVIEHKYIYTKVEVIKLLLWIFQ